MRAPHHPNHSQPSQFPLSIAAGSEQTPQRVASPEPHAVPQDDSASLDIAAILDDWDYEPNRVNVRKIAGEEGRPKLQIRLDLGLLQMEMTGRPDGRRPHDYVSLYDYHADRLNAYRTQFGTELGYVLSPNDCRELRDEAAMYYQRYLGLFVLGDYAATRRDTRRNLDVIDFCARHAAEERDRVAMEAYRPYVLMMHARASAGLCLEDDDPRGALAAIRASVRQIRDHFRRFGGKRAYQASGEVRVLKKLMNHLSCRLPASPVRRLTRELRQAVRREEYERAAKIRDELARLSG